MQLPGVLGDCGQLLGNCYAVARCSGQLVSRELLYSCKGVNMPFLRFLVLLLGSYVVQLFRALDYIFIHQGAQFLHSSECVIISINLWLNFVSLSDPMLLELLRFCMTVLPLIHWQLETLYFSELLQWLLSLGRVKVFLYQSKG